MSQEPDFERELGKTPISSDHPAGTDVSYDADYVDLVDEIKKLSSPTADSPADWSKIKNLSHKILSEQSKNLLVACYLSVSLLKIDGLKGCALGSHILRDLLASYWDTLYPPKKRKKGRINALSWWNETLVALTVHCEPETWEAAERQEFIDDLTAIDAFIGENLPDGPVLRSLIEHFSSLILEQEVTPVEDSSTEPVPAQAETIKDPQPAPPATSSAIHTNSGPQAPPPASGDGVDDNQDITPYEFILQGFEFLNHAAGKFFEDDPKNPLSYRITRLAAWAQIDSPPPSADGETLLPPPDDQLIALLNDQYASGRWEALLSTAEGNICQYLFWLDLNFWVATALEHLDAVAAAAAVADDTLLYVDRLKGIEALCFQGGIPYAADSTRKWLDQLRTPDQLPLASTATPQKTTVDEVCDKALQLVATKGVSEAVDFFHDHCPPSRGLKDTFNQDLIYCRIMLRGGKNELALPFAERMLTQINTNQLDIWDPDLAFRALLVIYNCFKNLTGQAYENRCRDLLHRLTLLSPEKVVNLI